MSLIRSMTVALMLPIAACSEGDGYNPIAPAASLKGTWVRVLDPAVDDRLIFVAVPAETLFVRDGRQVTWSQEVWLTETSRDRVRLEARVAERGAKVFLEAGCDDTILALCVAPQTVTGQEAPGTLTGTFELVRIDDDRLRMDMPLHFSRTSSWFRRVD